MKSGTPPGFARFMLPTSCASLSRCVYFRLRQPAPLLQRKGALLGNGAPAGRHVHRGVLAGARRAGRRCGKQQHAAHQRGSCRRAAGRSGRQQPEQVVAAASGAAQQGQRHRTGCCAHSARCVLSFFFWWLTAPVAVTPFLPHRWCSNSVPTHFLRRLLTSEVAIQVGCLTLSVLHPVGDCRAGCHAGPGARVATPTCAPPSLRGWQIGADLRQPG